MASEPLVVWLNDCSAEHGPLVGGKATGLGALVQQGFSVPPGFVVTTAAYRHHVEHNGLAPEIERLLGGATSYETQQQAAEQIRELFACSTPSTELHQAIVTAHTELCRRSTEQQLPCAVRSSATAEDLADASFAGQQETYLWILGTEQVVEHVVRCWASLFTPQAIAYRAHCQQPVTDLAMGVVVQCMVPAEAAGVMLTLDPITGDRSHITIEASYGLGAAVVNGEVTPDRYGVDKVLLEIRSRSISPKTVAYRFDPSVQGTRLEPVPAALQSQPCLSDEEVLELARLGKRMEQAAGRPQDLEWAIGPGREIFLLQARPETIWSQKQPEPLVAPGSTAMDRLLEMLRGPAATRKESS